jgi:hypothetical protein
LSLGSGVAREHCGGDEGSGGFEEVAAIGHGGSDYDGDEKDHIAPRMVSRFCRGGSGVWGLRSERLR